MLITRSRSFAVACALLAAGCGGGGGGGGGNPTPNPTVTLSAQPTSVVQGGTATLTWSTTNATACTASNGWTGTRATAGTEQVGPINAPTTFVLSCTGAGNTSGSATATVAMTAPPASVTLSGSISIPTTTQVDSDTNDSGNSTRRANDTFAQAQTLPNPVVVGGYTNRPGAGQDGPSLTPGDARDYYRVSLLRGQVIELVVADPAAGDLNLDLYSSTQTLVDSSVGNRKVHQLTVPASGTYFVLVSALTGASNYNLAIGQSGSTALVNPLVLSREFVPGEILVRTKAATNGARGAQQKQSRVANAYGLKRSYDVPDAHALMTLSTQSLQAAASSKPQLQEQELETQFESDEARLKWQTLQMVELLSKDPDIAWAEPNWIVHTQAVPNDPEYSRQRWHYEQISLPSAWNVTTGQPSVIVAVIDTGVRPHFDLVSRLVEGFDFVRGVGAGDGDDDDTDARDPGTPNGGSYTFHGTHVAGTIAAAGNDGQGGTGVAWNARIMPLRALGATGSGSTEDIIQSILFSARLANRSGTLPAQRADIINMSLGGRGLCGGAWQDAITRARAAGVIVIAAAGNDNADGDYTPAGCTGVVSVSSVGVGRTRAPYSNFGTAVDVAAPGGDMSVDRNGDGAYDGIFSTYSIRDGATYYSSYQLLQGTSMATPHVAGVAALMKSVNASLTPENFDTLLAAGSLTDDIGAPGRDSLGIGLINAAKAVRAAASATPPPAPPQLIVTPTTVNFGDIGTVNEVTIGNAGTGSVSTTTRATSAAWISVAPVQTDAAGLGTYRITINRAGLAAGTYNGWVEFRGNVGNPVRTSVLMQVVTTPSVPSAGYHYVLLIDSATGDTVEQVEVDANGGSVNYSFADVAPGLYELAAGTDMNNDQFICDEAEACTEYPLFGEVTPLEVTSDLTGLNMLTGFRSSPGSAATNETLPPLLEKKGLRRLR